MEAAHAGSLARGIKLYLRADIQGTRYERSGNNRPESLHGESAIDGKAQMLIFVSQRDRICGSEQLLFQIFHSGAASHTNRNDRSAFKKRIAHKFFDFEAHSIEYVGTDFFGFRDRYNSARDAQQAANIEVFASLRLDRFVGSDDKQNQINPAHAGEHIANEFFMTGNVNKSESNAIEIQEGKPEVNGDAATLFFFQPVRIGS